MCGFQTAFVMLHPPAYVVDMGLSANIGMSAVAMIGLFNIFGSFLSGWLGGLYSKKWLLAWIHALRIVAILALMLFPAQPAHALRLRRGDGPAVAGHGAAHQRPGRPHLRPALRRHAVRHRLLGHQIGGFLGPGWAGIFDLSGSNRDGVVAVDRAR